MTSNSSWEYLCYEDHAGPLEPNSDIGGKGVSEIIELRHD